MTVPGVRDFLARVALVVVTVSAAAGATDAQELPLFRLFMTDGTVVACLGEYARVDASVVCSLPLDQQETTALVQLDAKSVDWPRTDRYAASLRAAMYAQDVQIYLAPTWDTSDVWVPTLQHIAKEGRTFVIGCCQAIHSRDLPDSIPGKAELYGDEWLARGLSTIVAPGGRILAGPLEEKEGLVTASIDVSLCAEARGMFDPTGHYARPDVLRLHVEQRHPLPIESVQIDGGLLLRVNRCADRNEARDEGGTEHRAATN